MLNPLISLANLDETTPRQRKEKLYRLLHEKQKRMADASLYYFAKYVCGFADMEVQPHLEVCDWLQRNLWVDKMLLLPRNTFKSSIGSVALPLWLLTKDRNLRILLASGELNNTKNWLGLIKNIIERSDVFRRLYGDFAANKREDTWHATAIAISGRTRFVAEDSVTASSITVSKVSQHYDLAILDDLTNEKNVRQKYMIDTAESYLNMLLPILDPPRGIEGLPKPPPASTGPRLVIGTRWHFDDVHGRIEAKVRASKRAHEKPEWHTYVEKCAEKVTLIPSKSRRGMKKFKIEGKLFFPKRLSVDFLNRIQAGMSVYEFSCQYINDPMPEGTTVFDPRDFCFYWVKQLEDGKWEGKRVNGKVITPMPETMNIFTALDPSIGKKDTSDYSAFVTNAVDSDWNIYCVEVIEEHLIGNHAIIEEMFRIHEQFHPSAFGVEAVQFQESIIFGFEQACRERKKFLNVVPLPDSTIKKDLRIRGFAPWTRDHKFFLRVRSETDLTLPVEDLYYALEPGQEILADQLIRYPLGDKDDVLDAQAYIPKIIFPAAFPAKPQPADNTFTQMESFWRRGPHHDRAFGVR
jgi:hypothetical protein